MGRFDALTHIEESQPTHKPSSVPSSPTSNDQQPSLENDSSLANKSAHDTNLLANQQRSKPASKKTSLLVNQQTSKEVNQQTNLPANTQTSNLPLPSLSTKEKKKYGTYLREDSISAIQVHAIQTKQKDHEVLQQAVDQYFKDIK